MNFEVKDLSGLGQPLTKLIEVVSKGLGLVLEPYQIRRLARARANETAITEAAKTEASIKAAQALTALDHRTLRLIPGISQDVADRVTRRLVYQEVARQHNLDEVITHAVEALPASVNQEQPDADWTARFFNIASDVSDEQMQTLWGKILAGETAIPGTYSLRTLEVLRNITKSEAELFAQACSLVAGDNAFVLQIPSTRVGMLMEVDEAALSRFNLSFACRTRLAEAGLMTLAEITLDAKAMRKEPANFFYNGKYIRFELMDPLPPATGLSQIPPSNLPVVSFTEAGRSLGTLIPNNFNEDYVNLLIERYRLYGVNITVHPLS